MYFLHACSAVQGALVTGTRAPCCFQVKWKGQPQPLVPPSEEDAVASRGCGCRIRASPVQITASAPREQKGPRDCTRQVLLGRGTMTQISHTYRSDRSAFVFQGVFLGFPR